MSLPSTLNGLAVIAVQNANQVPTPLPGREYIFRDATDGLLYTKFSNGQILPVASIPPPFLDVKVKVTTNDSTPDFLQPKLVAGTNMGIVLNNPGGNETLTLNSTGEANTSSNVGTGATLANAKVGVNLPFKSLKAGTNITLTPSATEVLIDATGGGEVNTASNIGGLPAQAFKQKVGADLEFRTFGAGDAFGPLASNDLIVDTFGNQLLFNSRSVWKSPTANGVFQQAIFKDAINTTAGLLSAAIGDNISANADRSLAVGRINSTEIVGEISQNSVGGGALPGIIGKRKSMRYTLGLNQGQTDIGPMTLEGSPVPGGTVPTLDDNSFYKFTVDVVGVNSVTKDVIAVQFQGAIKRVLTVTSLVPNIIGGLPVITPASYEVHRSEDAGILGSGINVEIQAGADRLDIMSFVGADTVNWMASVHLVKFAS